MRKNNGFTLVELLIVMSVIAILIVIFMSSFRGLQNETRKTKAQQDLRFLKVAIESYYKNHNNVFPSKSDYQAILLGAYPKLLESNLYDPFGISSTTQYMYDLSADDPSKAIYYVVYSVGPGGNGTASIDNSGNITTSNEAIVDSNVHN